jgi:DNA-binding response OmpR family regulator
MANECASRRSRTGYIGRSQHGEESAQHRRTSSDHVPGDSMRVLSADDHSDCAESIAIFLSIAGFETRITLDGEVALRQACNWRPHVYVLDLVPKIDGCELAQRLRQEAWAKRVWMIALSAWTTAAIIDRAYQAGFNYYLRNPAEPNQILQVIQSALRFCETDAATAGLYR